MSFKNRLFLLDAYVLIFRSYYAFIKKPKINSKKLNTSAIFGFINFLINLIKKEEPTHIIVCFDMKEKTFRHKEFVNYKANREPTPEAIQIAIPYIYSILKAMKIHVLGISGYEADDLIGTLAKNAEKNNFETFIVTTDKDFAQLVSEKIFIYKPAIGKNESEILGIEEVKKKFQIEYPVQITDLLGMMGDSADNVPGLPGVGKKTAIKFIKEFGSLENLFQNIEKIKGKIRKNIENNKNLGFLSKKLVTINLNVPLDFIPKKFILRCPDQKKIYLLFKELEFNTLYKNIYSFYFEKELFNNVQLSLFEVKKKYQNIPKKNRYYL